MSEIGAIFDISVVIVSWRVRDLLKRAITSIDDSVDQARRAGHALNVEVIVIDNNSDDGTMEMVRSLFPTVHLIINKVNCGFASANNQALIIARGRYILFLNPDAELLRDALWKMYEFMREQPLVGLVGPKLENDDGSLQRSCRRFPTFWSALMVLLKLHNFFPNSFSIRQYYMWSFKYQTIRRVDQVMGACMMVNRNILDEVGYFDEIFFIFFEEVDLCKRINEAGYIIFFYPEAVVRHRRSSAFAQRRVLWRQWRFASSCRHYFWKHHGVLSASLLAIVSFVSLGPALILALIYSLGIRLAKNRDL